MVDTISILIIILILLNIITFSIGYIFGKIQSINSSQAVFGSQLSNKNRGSNIGENSQNKITIDDRKFVTDINTDGIEKKYTKLGDTKVMDDDINNSVNKLQSLKR